MTPALTRHVWSDLVAAYWRRDASALEGLLPPGVRPDVVDGSAWAGLSAYVFRDTTIPPLPPPPGRIGTLTEVALVVPTVDDAGRRGESYLTIETDHLLAIALARTGIGVPYRAARAGTRTAPDGTIEHRSRRASVAGPRPRLRVRARPSVRRADVPGRRPRAREPRRHPRPTPRRHDVLAARPPAARAPPCARRAPRRRPRGRGGSGGTPRDRPGRRRDRVPDGRRVPVGRARSTREGRAVSVLETALAHPRSSVRLQAVMDAGTRADLADLDVLVARCAVEPDLFVRDMLSWALARLPADVVVPRLLDELRRDDPRARSQALHTLSKIGDRSVYPSVVEHVGDVDPGVGRTAWRAAVALVPDDRRAELATRLGEQLGHGDAETRLALSRAIVALGADVAAPVLAHARESRFDAVREHAAEIERILRDPDAASELAVRAARRQVALGRTRDAKG